MQGKRQNVWSAAGWLAAGCCALFFVFGAGKGLFLAGILSPRHALLAAQQTLSQNGEIPVWQQLGNAVLTFGDANATSEAPVNSSGEGNAPAESATPPEGMKAIVATTYTAGAGKIYIQSGAGWVKNCTDLSAATVRGAMMQPLPFTIELNSSQPQVLIMHTHATECYNPAPGFFSDPAFACRSTDNAINEVRVGQEIAAVLNAGGINTVQSTVLHDYPSYNGSYARSRATVEEYLAKYPSIKIVLDIHRDAIEKEDGTRVKPVCTVNGEQAAQIMIICGADNGSMNMPNYMQNLRFASRLQNAVELAAPGITRPVLFDYRNYNQQLTTGSLLIEMGGHANTLEEALVAARYVAQGLVDLAYSQF